MNASGLEPTPAEGNPVQFCCPRCGFPFPKRAEKVQHKALLKKLPEPTTEGPFVERKPVDRLAPTERIPAKPEES